MIDRIQARNLGPLKEADVRFGDLTVLVGPQATGKSIFLQTVKLLVDGPGIHGTLRHFGANTNGKNFFDHYFGEGMASIWKKNSELFVGNKGIDLTSLACSQGSNRPEKMFYIPAQRAMSLRDGATRPFNDYLPGTPFVLRDFSDKVNEILLNEIGVNENEDVFPGPEKFVEVLRKPLEKHIFCGFQLKSDTSAPQRRLVLKKSAGSRRALPYLVWSTGQRESVPLLLGLYWLLPSGGASKRGHLNWVVIEEPEMGLHPDGVGSVLNLVMELLTRGYRVCLSTHSLQILDVVWALRFFQSDEGDAEDVRELFGLPSTSHTRKMANIALKCKFKTYFSSATEKSGTFPTSIPDPIMSPRAGGGGITDYSDNVGRVVARVANRGLSDFS